MRKIIFCHGLESAPRGAKFHALEAAGLEVLAPDCRKLNLADRVERILGVLREQSGPASEAPVLVGSSYGGIAALCAAILHKNSGGSLSPMILCAPALARAEAPADTMVLRAPTLVTVVHGIEDKVIPIALSRHWVGQNSDATLIEVEGGHRLTNSLALITQLSARAANKEV